MEGRRIGPYPVEDLVGMGGFASVYRTHGRDGTPLVLKVADQSGQGPRTFPVRVRPARAVAFRTGSYRYCERLDTAGVMEVFRAEARALRSAAGHRLPKLIDELVTEDGLPVLVLEQLSVPWSLEPAPMEDFARILEACADLRTAGLHGHGDLKPEHVFVDASGEFVFIDPAYDSLDFRTLTPEYTPWPYLRPPGADVCALAVMLYQRLTGVIPWSAQDWRARALSQLARMEQDRTQPGAADVTTPVAGIAGWVTAVLGWVQALLDAGAGLDAALRAKPRQPEWLADHARAAAQLRAAITARPAGSSPG